jgi:LAO/AO transport system kinase
VLKSAEALERAIADSDGMAQRRAIAKAITLLESTRADHRTQADELLTALLACPVSANRPSSKRWACC